MELSFSINVTVSIILNAYMVCFSIQSKFEQIYTENNFKLFSYW